MGFIQEIVGVPLGYIVWAIYELFHSYGLAIIIFTIITKLAMLPIAIKQKKSSAKMMALQPKMAEINKKYEKNPQKKQEELYKLQQEYGYSTLGGCLPLLLQFVILFGIIDVVYKPLTHMLHLSKDVIAKAAELAGLGTATMTTQQMGIVTAVQANPEKFASLGGEVVDKIGGFSLNMFGLNLGEVPKLMWPIILVPILAAVFSFAQVFISMKLNPATNAQGSQGGMMKGMMFMTPLLSLWISFSVPVGVGLYWMFNYIVGIIQELVLYKIYPPERLKEKALAEMEAQREANRPSKKVVVQQKVVADSGEEVEVEETLSQKELNRQRLARARALDAEKYEEEYDDVSEEDLK